MVTVFTPTYNRASILPKLYQSLCLQTSKDFEWLIVDDGSTDNTEHIVSKWLNESLFRIRYFKKSNGGKHTAINVGTKLAEGELFFIVDSDDTLTDDAVKTILHDWNEIDNEKLCGIVYQRGRFINDILMCNPATLFPKSFFVNNYIEMKYNKGTSADHAEVWSTECLRKHPFTEYVNEKFMSEGIVWIRIAKEKDMLFRNKIIYICEYLDGGLTDQGKKLRFLCPKGGIEGSLETMSNHFNLKMRIKQTLLYIVYSKFDQRNITDILRCPYKRLTIICLPAGYLIYYYWKNKYFGNDNSKI